MHYSGTRASLRLSLLFLLFFMLVGLGVERARGAAVSLTSPEGVVYVGDQLKFYQVDADGIITVTTDRDLQLHGMKAKNFKLSGQVWLGGPSPSASPSDKAPDGFAVVVRQVDGDHRYELTSRALIFKPLKPNGPIDKKFDHFADFQKPSLGEWTPFSAEVTSGQITFMFGGQQGVIPGPLDTDGINYVSLSSGTKLRYLQLEVLADSDNTTTAASASSTSTANSPPARRKPQATVQDFLKAMVIIKGELGQGSGFIVRKNDQLCIVTNQHVLSGNSNFTITGVDGTKYPTNGALFGAVGYDVAMLRIPEAKNFISVDDYSAAGAAIDDSVVVLGNAEGGGVVTKITGKLLGVGPELIEVNAKFVQGNSGSPIVDNSTHTVVGIATYAMKNYTPDELQRAANTPPLRWFGYRLDTIKEWQELDWKRFNAEGDRLAAVEQRTESFIQIFPLLRSHSPTQTHLPDSNIDAAYATYVRETQKAIADASTGDALTAQKKLLATLTTYLDNDTNDLSAQNLYSYHADELKAQLQIRDVIREGFQEIIIRVQHLN